MMENHSTGKLRWGKPCLALLLGLLLGACASHTESPPPNQASSASPAPARTLERPKPEIEKPSLKKTGLSAADRKAWREILKWPESCEQGFDYADKSYAGLEFYALADKQYLIEVVCTRGAYQGSQVYFYYDENPSPPAAQSLSFTVYESPDGKSLVKQQTYEIWGLPAFDSKTKELTVLNKYRGPGDCGSLARYGFSGRMPLLKELRAKPECDGEGAEHPERWKQINIR